MTAQNELAALIARHTPNQGRNETAIAELRLSRAANAGLKIPNIYEPALCLIAQGQKQIFCGSHIYPYSPEIYLLVPMSLPLSGQIIEASPEKPYLGLQISLNMPLIAEMLPLALSRQPKAVEPETEKIIVAAPADAALLDAVLRLVKLLDSPQDIAALSGLVLREIYYRLLRGSQGNYLARMARPDGHAARIGNAVNLIKTHLAEPLKISDLADAAHMSISAFHAGFRQITSFSPLQYQKQLRLLEGRRLIMRQCAGIAEADYQLSYQSASQFSREYSRLFGVSPKQDLSTAKERTRRRN